MMGIVSAGLVTSAASSTFAASDPVAAQILFDEAKKLVAAGQTGDACPKFEESLRLDSALGTLLNLADCYEKQGRTASAWSRFTDAEGRARAEGHPDVATFAHQRSESLTPRLSKIAIHPINDAMPAMVIRRDDVVVGRAQWDVPIAVDPGQHTIVAEAPGYRRWEQKVEVGNEPANLTVRVPALEVDATAAGVAPPPAEAGEQRAPAGTDSSVEGGGLGAQKVIAITAGSVGIAAAILGTVFGVRSMQKHDEAFHGEYCYSDCETERTALNEAKSAGNVSTVAFTVSAVALGAGAVLWFTAPPARNAATGQQGAAETRLGVRAGMIVLQRSW